MRLWSRIKHSNFLIKLLNWEYWPFTIIYAPAFFYWLYLSAKARSLFFFSAANPQIETGGLVGESKINILKRLPEQLIPRTIYIPCGESMKTVTVKLSEAGIKFPLIAKPNVGSRGFLVKKVSNTVDLEKFLSQQHVDFLLQEYVDYEVETSVLYYRFPNHSKGKISSVTLKKYLTVTGNGYSTVEELIRKQDRAKLQLETLKSSQAVLMDLVPEKEEIVELVPIGNHCRGATFYNGNHLIDENLEAAFDEISHQIEGIYFGRFDIKCKDIESLKQGKHYKILEINGVGAEPAHIYDPDYRLLRAFKDILNQWKIIYQISVYNRRNGVDFMSGKEAWQTLVHLFTYKKFAGSSSGGTKKESPA